MRSCAGGRTDSAVDTFGHYDERRYMQSCSGDGGAYKNKLTRGKRYARGIPLFLRRRFASFLIGVGFASECCFFSPSVLFLVRQVCSCFVCLLRDSACSNDKFGPLELVWRLLLFAAVPPFFLSASVRQVSSSLVCLLLDSACSFGFGFSCVFRSYLD